MVDRIITLLAIRKQRQCNLGHFLMLAKVQVPQNFGDKGLYLFLSRSSQPCKLKCEFCKSGLSA